MQCIGQTKNYNNDFYGTQCSVKYTRHRTTLSQTCALWPLNITPDLNPVDYKVWDVIQEPVYRRPILDVADLKRRLTAAWSDLQKCVIDEANDQQRGPWTAVSLCEN